VSPLYRLISTWTKPTWERIFSGSCFLVASAMLVFFFFALLMISCLLSASDYFFFFGLIMVVLVRGIFKLSLNPGAIMSLLIYTDPWTDMSSMSTLRWL
jgi:hypothetical protein